MKCLVVSAVVVGLCHAAALVAWAEPHRPVHRWSQQVGAPSRSRATLVVDLQGLRSDRGVLRLALYANAGDFPDASARATRASIVPIRGRRARVVWSDVAPGRYAVGVFHDENANGTLDKNWVGMPVEGSGFSRDATGSWGPPDYDDAALDLPTDRIVRTTIPIRYF